MERKKMTESQLSSNEVRERIKTDAEAAKFKPEPVYRRMDSEYSDLTDNDCWYYQNELERQIRVALPDDMNKRYLNMLWHLAAQARKGRKDVEG